MKIKKVEPIMSQRRTPRGGGTGGRGRSRDDAPRRPPPPEWNPRTRLGRLVKDGEITSIEEVFASKRKIQDLEIVDRLVPDLEETVLDVKRVQRQTDAGRKTTFAAIAVVGNRNGIVGVGSGRDVGMGTAIRAAIQDAKLNIIPVKRGSGTWEDSTNEPHSLPFKVVGSCASVRATLIPAPRGTGLVTGEVAKKLLKLAGIKDIWSQTQGDTRTSANYVKAVFDALKKTYHIMTPNEWR